MLGQVGKKYIKELGYIYSKPSYKKEYVERMTTISLLASLFIGNGIEFTPSFELKDFTHFRTQSRPFIGSIKFNRNDYLVYYISKKSSKRFCNSIIYDFQKEQKYIENLHIVCSKNIADILSKYMPILKKYIIVLKSI